MANHDIDIALDVMCKLALPQQTLSRISIAELCGCTSQNIYLIETSALKKLRKKAAVLCLDDYLEVTA